MINCGIVSRALESGVWLPMWLRERSATHSLEYTRVWCVTHGAAVAALVDAFKKFMAEFGMSLSPVCGCPGGGIIEMQHMARRSLESSVWLPRWLR